MESCKPPEVGSGGGGGTCNNFIILKISVVPAVVVVEPVTIYFNTCHTRSDRGR